MADRPSQKDPLPLGKRALVAIEAGEPGPIIEFLESGERLSVMFRFALAAALRGSIDGRQLQFRRVRQGRPGDAFTLRDLAIRVEVEESMANGGSYDDACAAAADKWSLSIEATNKALARGRKLGDHPLTPGLALRARSEPKYSHVHDAFAEGQPVAGRPATPVQEEDDG